MTRDELIEYIRLNDRIFDYSDVNFNIFSYSELLSLKRRIDEENQETALKLRLREIGKTEAGLNN